MSGVRGANKLRKTLRRAPEEIREGVVTAVDRGAEAVWADAVERVPRDEGDLARAIQIKKGRDGLTAVVGPGAKAAELAARKAGRLGLKRNPFAGAASTRVRLSRTNQDLLFQWFKAIWIEFGTKGSPEHNIPPQPPRPFMGPAAELNQDFFATEARRAVNDALDRLSRGTT